MQLMVKAGPGGLWWTMARSRDDATVVAQAACACRDVAGCYEAAMALGRSPVLAKTVVRDHDGRWRWRAADNEGVVFAESANGFDNQAECGYALYEVRHTLATVQRGSDLR